MTAPSNANTSGLAPCPFCGGAPSVRQAMGETWVVCGSCAASTQSKGRESVAFDLWNRRVTAASAQARIAELEARIEYLRRSRDGHAAQAHAEFEKRVMAVDALISAREALHHHYVEWDGEPEDAVPLQEARSECDRVLAALQQETQP